jgi:hypothetical protein
MTTATPAHSDVATSRKVVMMKDGTRPQLGDNPCGAGSTVGWFDVLFLILLVACGGLLRLDFMRAVEYTIDSDEAIVGLMAKHILEGAPVPTFYYGQHYMGSLEAIMASASFWLFGMSGFTLQLVPLAWSLVFIVVMFFLGRECGGVVVGRIAALLTAVPPVALVVWSSKARGGFIEIVVLGALAMLATARWFKETKPSTTYPIVIGVLLGLGWWVNNQILYFMVPIALFSFLYLVRGLQLEIRSILESLRVVLFGSLAFLVGSTPYWLYNLERGFPSMGMFGRAPLREIARHCEGLLDTAIPILLGAKHFWETDQIFPASTAVYYAVYGLIFVAALYARRTQLRSLMYGKIDSAAPIEMILSFLAVACAIFVVSTFGWLSKAPRYLLPTYVGLFVVCGYACGEVLRRSRTLGVLCIACILALNITSSYAGGRAIPGEPIVFAGERVSRDHSELLSVLERLGITKVKTNYWIGYRLAFETNERVTFYGSGDPLQVRIQAYESGLGDAERELVPLLAVRSEAEAIRPGLMRLGFTFKEIQASGYTLFYGLEKDERGLVPIPSTEIAETRAQGPQMSQTALDGSSHTRWGSGEPQHPGMTFEVLFAKTQKLAAIEYDLGEWAHDYPRGLEIQILKTDGSTTTVLSNQEFQSIRYFMQENTVVPILFPEHDARGVRFVQTGSHPTVDWSIAELRFFSRR